MNYIFRLSYNKIYGIGPRYNVPSAPRVSLSRAPFFLTPVTSKRLPRRLGSHQICEFVV